MELNIQEIDGDTDDDVVDLGFSDYPISHSNKIQYVNPYATTTPISRDTTARNTVVSTKKGVTYDDILSNLNMQVVNGKLQISRNVPITTTSGQSQQQQQQQQYQQKQSTQSFKGQSFRDQMKPAPMLSGPMLSGPMLSGPMLTPEQHRRLKIAQYIRQVNEYRRIKQIKSTKMFFNNPNISTSHSVPLWMQHK